jgi:hypothetical protein
MARFNKRVTNRLTRPLAPGCRAFGVVIHRGRKSGRVYETPVNVFRAGGGYVVALTIEGAVVLTRTSRRSDEELIAQLTTVRGIGRWTAEMYLLFQLRRLDVWPVDDLGVRQGYALAWGVDPTPTARERSNGSS